MGEGMVRETPGRRGRASSLELSHQVQLGEVSDINYPQVRRLICFPDAHGANGFGMKEASR